MNLIVPICASHNYPTTRYCCHAAHTEGQTYDATCLNVFCKLCIYERRDLMTDNMTREVGHMLCDKHFYEYCEISTKGKAKANFMHGIPLAKRLTLLPGMNYSDLIESSSSNFTNVASADADSLQICEAASVGPVKSLPPPESPSFFNVNLASNLMDALQLSVKREYRIPDNVSGEPKKSRPLAMNNAWLFNFFGLVLWSHISDGHCWITKGDLKNSVKVKVLHDVTELFHHKHPQLFSDLMNTRGHKIQPDKIVYFCANQRVAFRNEIWHAGSGKRFGLFEQHHVLLKKIGFPFEK